MRPIALPCPRGRPSPSRRLRLLLWTLVIGLVIGALGILEPLDDGLGRIRNLSRAQRASDDIVVVSIDDRSLASVARWPWPRHYHAQLIDAIERLDPEHIFIDLSFYAPSNPRDDAELAAALARAKGRVTLAARYMIDPMTGARTDFLPLPDFRRFADMASIDWEYKQSGGVTKLPYAVMLGGRPLPSLSAHIAGVSGAPGETYTVDYAIDPRSVPTLSAVDVMMGKVSRAAIAGKRIVIAAGSQQLADVWLARGHGMVPGAYIHVLGAETLAAGMPREIPWALPFAVAMLVGACAVRLRSHLISTVLLGGTTLCLLIIPLPLEAHGVTMSIGAALFALVVIGINRLWNLYRSSYRLRGTTNIVSGLPNLNGLREDGDRTAALIAARIQNYTEISAALPPELEKSLVEQIVRRLTLGDPELKIYQGDEGIFAWFLDIRVDEIGPHLSALAALLRAPIQVEGRSFDIAISFGVDPDIERTLTSRLAGALVAADEAAHRVEKWKFYDVAALKEAGWKLSLLGQLDAAIDDGSVWVAYQPKMDLATRRITGAEALVRWTHAEKGLISPLEFIPAAEQNNRIDKLTFHVLDRAVQAAASLNAHGILFDISVNMSPRVFDNRDLIRRVDEILARHKLAPARLTLEVTETASVNDGSRMRDALVALRKRGVRISIDDYGTGLSTLEYLRDMPGDEIKIDRSFIKALIDNDSDRLMVRSTIELAHSLGRVVVAEGIEDEQTLDALAEMGCDIAQGFFLGRPQPFTSLARMLIEERSTRAG